MNRELRDVPELRIKWWMCQSKQLLVEIFQRKVYSHRHENFITSSKHRGTCKYTLLCNVVYYISDAAYLLMCVIFSFAALANKHSPLLKGAGGCHHSMSHEMFLSQEHGCKYRVRFCMYMGAIRNVTFECVMSITERFYLC